MTEVERLAALLEAEQAEHDETKLQHEALRASLDAALAREQTLAEQCTNYAAKAEHWRREANRRVEPAWVGTNPQFNSNNGF